MARGEYEAAARELEGLVAADREDLRAQLLLVSSYLAADQLEQARAAALERVRAQPEDPAWHTLLAAVENQSGAPAAARRALTQALELDADYLPARAILGRIELEAGQLAAAGVQYTRIVERQPGHLPSLMALARIAEHEGRTPDALAYLQRARRGHPDALLPRILQGVLFLRSGMPAEAVSVGREAVDIAPDDGRALALLAEAELAAGAPGEALPALRALAAQQPGNADVRAALARAFAATGRAREARIEFQQVLRLEPESAEARIGLGRIALQEGRAAEALEMAAALQRIIPERAYGYVLEGDARLLAQRPSEALPAYRAAWERDPSPELARQIARVQSQMGDDDAAVRSLQAARERYPDDGALGLSLAISLHASGREALAEAQYRGVLRADPDNVTALNNLAWLLHERGEPEALDLARRAYALAPRSAAVTDTLGWLTLQGGDVVAGAELLERAARLQRLPSVLYHLAVARVEQGEPEAARALLEEALAAEAPFARADEARALLSAL
jgi:putative PEP-CTERM system TPR-repeat lipoprotein